MDWNKPVPDSDDSEQVDVPIINRPLMVSEMDVECLLQVYNCFQYHAVDLYVELVDHETSMIL